MIIGYYIKFYLFYTLGVGWCWVYSDSVTTVVKIEGPYPFSCQHCEL